MRKRMETYDILFALGRKQTDISINTCIPENGMFYQALVPGLGYVCWHDDEGKVGQIKVHLFVEVKWHRDVYLNSIEELSNILAVVNPDARRRINEDKFKVEKAVLRVIRAQEKAKKEAL